VSGIALVTGASGGLGAALAISLARDGFALALHYHRNEAGARSTFDAITAAGVSAALFQADLTLEGEAAKLAGAVGETFGTLDVLVNNAGVYTDRAGEALSAGEWHTGIDTTATATFFTTRALLPLLRSGRGKRIINIGDSSAERPGARDLAWGYHVGKTGVWILTRSFAAEEAANGIACNMVSPGLLANSIGDLSAERVPAGRLGTFEDIYSAVRFLAIDATPYLSGSNLVVSGGWNLR
jgi:3-oxoacyl-[acyl-carrier protein] reductase